MHKGEVVPTERAVMFLIRVLGTVPVPDHAGLLNRRLPYCKSRIHEAITCPD